MLNRLRRAVEPLINRLGFAAARTRLPATAWTAIGLIFATLSALSYSHLLFGDGLYGGLLLLISGLVDMVDGAVARATNSASHRGAFLDSTLDRVGEVFVFRGILAGGVGDSRVVLLALSFSLLVSYTRARGEALRVEVSGIGVGERAERILVLGVLSIAGYTYYGVIVVLILALITFIHRLVAIAKTLSKQSQ